MCAHAISKPAARRLKHAACVQGPSTPALAMAEVSFSRFSSFARGKIVGKAEEGVTEERIRDTVRKKDGTRGSVRGIRAVVAKARADPAWDGQDSRAGGRPCALTAEDTAALKQLIHEEVGLAKVTIPYCRKRLPCLKRVSNECVRRTLHRLGLAWRLRRGKAAVSRKYKPDRLRYARWVLRQPPAELRRWAYMDGTTLSFGEEGAQVHGTRPEVKFRGGW